MLASMWFQRLQELTNGGHFIGTYGSLSREGLIEIIYQIFVTIRLLWLGWHIIAATAIKPPKAACQFAADDILLYEFCYYNPMDLLHHLEKGKD